MGKKQAGHHSSDYYIKAAEDNGLRVERGKGSHTKVYGPAGRGFMVIPHGKDLSPGVENQIKKWFLKIGIVLTLMLLCYGVYLVQAAMMYLAR